MKCNESGCIILVVYYCIQLARGFVGGFQEQPRVFLELAHCSEAASQLSLDHQEVDPTRWAHSALIISAPCSS